MSVAKIMKQFTKVVVKLEKHGEESKTQAENIQTRIQLLRSEQSGHEVEAEKAFLTAEKIKGLLPEE